MVPVMRLWVRSAVFSLLLLCSFSHCAYAQTISLKSRPYVESFVGKAKVSGNLLVGLRYGETAENFDPKAIGLVITPKVGGRAACVDISSRDGLYFAQNMYNIPVASGNLVPFETGTAYSAKLSQYNIGDIAVTVRLINDCNSPDEGEIVPAIVNSPFKSIVKSSHNPPLVALENAEPDRLRVALFKNGVEAATATCSSDPNAVQISFTSSCEFKGSSALAPGSYDLLIRVRERFASRDSHFSVQLP